MALYDDINRWEMTMNDHGNDNDMKWHDMRKMCDCSVCGSGCCLLDLPPPLPLAPLLWSEVLVNSIYPTQSCMYMYIILPNLDRVPSIIPEHTQTPILSFLDMFLPVVIQWCLLPCGGATCSLKLFARGQFFPYHSQPLQAFRSILVATDHSRNVFDLSCFSVLAYLQKLVDLNMLFIF